MNGCAADYTLEHRQARVIRWTMLFSLLFHAGAILLGTAVSSLFPGARPLPVVEIELTDAPPASLLEEEPPAPSVKENLKPLSETTAERSMKKPSGGTPLSTADGWLAKLDSSLARVTDAPVVGKTVKTGGLPVRRWENGAAPRPGDFPPEVAPERNLALGAHLEDLENRIRRSGRPGVGIGEENEAAVMFGGAGSSSGDPLPAWIRDMIRRKVLGYLPELEEVYSAAYRRNPEIKGKLVVRFLVGPSGTVHRANPAESSFSDEALIASVLERIRRWTFDPTAGRTVDVLYPFVFVPPY